MGNLGLKSVPIKNQNNMTYLTRSVSGVELALRGGCVTDEQYRRVLYYSENSGGFTPDPGPIPALLLDDCEDKVIAVTKHKRNRTREARKSSKIRIENRQNVPLLYLRNRQNWQAAAVLTTAESTKLRQRFVGELASLTSAATCAARRTWGT